MSEKFELNTFAECRFDTSDQDDYEAPSPGRNAENEYVSIKDIAEGGMQQYNAVHNNTSMCIGSSECNNTRTQRSYRRTQPDGPDANEEIKAISKRLAETATALKRLKIICIALGVALVMISVTIGALMLIMMERIGDAERTSENMQFSIGKLQAKTGTSISINLTLEEQVSKMEEKLSNITTDSEGVKNGHDKRIADLEQAFTEGNSLVRNYSVKLLELDGAYNLSGAIIGDHTTRLAELERASINSVIMIKNHTSELFKFEMVHNSSEALIERHTEKIAVLETASSNSKTLILNNTAKLLELEIVQTTCSAEIQVLSAKIPELEKVNTNLNVTLSGYGAVIAGHTAKLANLEKASVDTNTLILNHTAYLLELAKVQTTSSANFQVLSSKITDLENANRDINTDLSSYDALINGHTAKIADLEKVSFDSNTLILNHTAMLLELGKAQTSNSANVQVLTSKITDINNILTYYNDTLRKEGSTVAFSAYVDRSTPLSTSTKTVFNRVLTNEHQAYDVSTGVFTCPISGIYMFSFVAAARGDTSTWTVLKMNGGDVLHSYTEGTEANQDVQGANIAVVKLSTGDEVWISGSGTFARNSGWGLFYMYRTSSFSGFLVQPDSTVAFSAYISNSTSLLNKTIFDMVLTNEHQAYDVSTGVFTCPISGIYMFSFVAGTQIFYLVNKAQHITESQYSHQPAQPSFMGNRPEVAGRTRITTANLMATRGDASTWAVLKVNGGDVLHSFTEGTEPQQDVQGANIAVLKLSTGDEVWISGSGTLPGNSGGGSTFRTSSFSGFLVQSGSTVAFSAYISSSTTLSSSRPTVFNRLLTNELQAYDVSTGVFTCPFSGIYMFSFVAAVRDARATWAVLKVNGDDVLHSYAEGTQNSQDLQGTNIAVVKLSPGDEVWISGSGTLPGNSGGSSDYRTSSFSGYLVQTVTD